MLFDQPTVIAGAESVFAEARVGARATVVGGDFFSEVPSGGDVYLLKSVLHNWPDGEAARILHAAAGRWHSDARLLVADRIVPTGNAPSEAKLFDINMLVVVGGRERTEEEDRRTARPGRVCGVQVIGTTSALSLIEGSRWLADRTVKSLATSSVAIGPPARRPLGTPV